RPYSWASLFSFFFSSRRRHTRFSRDWSSDVCSSDLVSSNLEFGSGEDISVNVITGYVYTTQDYAIDFADGRGLPSLGTPVPPVQIGRASCRERVEMWEVDGALEQEKGFSMVYILIGM